jgi:hypothetical protein
MIARRSWLGISSTKHQIKSETPHFAPVDTKFTWVEVAAWV